jgi:hypothetical protein
MRLNRSVRRAVTSSCKYCGRRLKSKARGPQKRYCRDACRYAARRERKRWVAQQIEKAHAKFAEIRHFREFLDQARREKKAGGDIAKLVTRKIRGGWVSIDLWSTDPASAWRDLAVGTKKIIILSRPSNLPGMSRGDMMLCT